LDRPLQHTGALEPVAMDPNSTSERYDGPE
jgi:hypothetical protein